MVPCPRPSPLLLWVGRTQSACGPGSSAPRAASLATLFTFRRGDRSHRQAPREMEEGDVGAEAGAPAGGTGSDACLAHHSGGGRCRQGLRAGLECSWPGLCFPQMLAPAKQQWPVALEAWPGIPESSICLRELAKRDVYPSSPGH